MSEEREDTKPRICLLCQVLGACMGFGEEEPFVHFKVQYRQRTAGWASRGSDVNGWRKGLF